MPTAQPDSPCTQGLPRAAQKCHRKPGPATELAGAMGAPTPAGITAPSLLGPPGSDKFLLLLQPPFIPPWQSLGWKTPASPQGAGCRRRRRVTSSRISDSHQLCTPTEQPLPTAPAARQEPQEPSPAKAPDLLLNLRLHLLQHACATLLPSPGQGRRAEQAAAAPDRALASRGSPCPWGAPGYSGPLGKHVAGGRVLTAS